MKLLVTYKDGKTLGRVVTHNMSLNEFLDSYIIGRGEFTISKFSGRALLLTQIKTFEEQKIKK